MKARVLSIRKQWDEPNILGLNRFEVEYVDDQGEEYYTSFRAVDEAEAYKLFLQSLDRRSKC